MCAGYTGTSSFYVFCYEGELSWYKNQLQWKLLEIQLSLSIEHYLELFHKTSEISALIRNKFDYPFENLLQDCWPVLN